MTQIPKQSQPEPLVSRRRPASTPDLHSQLEGLLDAVWEAEANWRLDDRIDLATRTLRKSHS